MPRTDERLAWAEAKARECRRIALRYFRSKLKVERKADRSPVTIADRAIEEFLRKALARDFPKDAIVGEEFGGSPAAAASYWTIDPIDGTRAFSRGLPSWGILLSWVEQGEAVIGACDFPAIKTFMGGGLRTAAYERGPDGHKVALPKARSAPPIEDTVLFHGGSSWWLPTRYAAGFSRLVQSCYLERAYGDCYAYLWLFRGHVDAMIDHGCKIWDLAPMGGIAKSTGHALVDCANRPSFRGPDTILAHPALAKALAAILSGVDTPKLARGRHA